MLADGAAEGAAVLGVARLAEALGGEHQRPRGVEVRVRRRLAVGHAAVLPVPGEQAVGPAQVIARPGPHAIEALLVALGDGEQHRVGLALADRVAALVVAHDPAVVRHVAVEEAAPLLLLAARGEGEREEQQGDQQPHAGAGADLGRGPASGSRRRAGETPASSTTMCNAAKATLLSVAGSRSRSRP